MTQPRTPIPGGELEEAVLTRLWQIGTGTVRDVHASIGAPRDLVYTTIARVLDRLAACWSRGWREGSA